MEIKTTSGKTRTRFKKSEAGRFSSPDVVISVEGRTYLELLKNSLSRLAFVLSPGSCLGATHYDCIMKVKASGEDIEDLFIDFLNKVLMLTHDHHAIFCTMHIEEFKNEQLEAQIYGVWFKDFDKDLKWIKGHKCAIEQQEDFSCNGFIVFKR